MIPGPVFAQNCIDPSYMVLAQRPPHRTQTTAASNASCTISSPEASDARVAFSKRCQSVSLPDLSTAI